MIDSDTGDYLPPGAIRVGPVEYWASLGNYDQTQKAISEGNDVNATSDGGYTALHAAAENNHIEVVKLLLEHGADAAASLVSGETAADLAALSGNKDVVELLSQ